MVITDNNSSYTHALHSLHHIATLMHYIVNIRKKSSHDMVIVIWVVRVGATTSRCTMKLVWL
jgi:hypothetical protein